jgi:hypothetical protein
MILMRRVPRALAVALVVALGIANGQLYADDDCDKYCGYGLQTGSGVRNGCGAGGCPWVCCEGSYAGCESYTYPNCNDDCYTWIPCG